MVAAMRAVGRLPRSADDSHEGSASGRVVSDVPDRATWVG
jgi:hypothetical protein